jgi:probable DNA metabolism protein
MRVVSVKTFDQWRAEARRSLLAGLDPDAVEFQDGWQAQVTLPFGCEATDPSADGMPADGVAPSFGVPRSFLKLGKHLACHREAERWNLLYRMLWRLTHGEPGLLEISTDDDVYLTRTWEKQVRRDAHKMKAFVRFRRCIRDDEEWFVAWHRPDHRVARLVAPFFADRFSTMRWTILMPDESLCWNLHELQFGPGSNRASAPNPDELEQMWKSYYASTFNPARIKLKAMKAEMPRRYWPALPETEIIDEMLAAAPKRVAEMATSHENWSVSAADFLPENQDLESLRLAAQGCQGCPLYTDATQTVFGEGPPDARLVLIGEQPGDEEDLAGRPFVGPAGRVLNGVLREVGVDRKQVYMTNAVKHFKHVQRGKKRLHEKPKRIEVVSCRAWLERELVALAPQVVVCLGATAASCLISPSWQISKQRGHVVETQWCSQTLATYHPSAILRSQDERGANAKRKAMVEDLQLALSLFS